MVKFCLSILCLFLSLASTAQAVQSTPFVRNQRSLDLLLSECFKAARPLAPNLYVHISTYISATVLPHGELLFGSKQLKIHLDPGLTKFPTYYLKHFKGLKSISYEGQLQSDTNKDREYWTNAWTRIPDSLEYLKLPKISNVVDALLVLEILRTELPTKPRLVLDLSRVNLEDIFTDLSPIQARTRTVILPDQNNWKSIQKNNDNSTILASHKAETYVNLENLLDKLHENALHVLLRERSHPENPKTILNELVEETIDATFYPGAYRKGILTEPTNDNI